MSKSAKTANIAKTDKLSGMALRIWQIANWEGDKHIAEIAKAVKIKDGSDPGGAQYVVVPFSDAFDPDEEVGQCEGIMRGIATLDPFDLWFSDADIADMMGGYDFTSDVIAYMRPVSIIMRLGIANRDVDLITLAHEYIGKRCEKDRHIEDEFKPMNVVDIYGERDIRTHLFLTEWTGKHWISMSDSPLAPLNFTECVTDRIERLYYLGEYEEILEILKQITEDDLEDGRHLLHYFLRMTVSQHVKSPGFVMKIVKMMIDTSINWEIDSGKAAMSGARMDIVYSIRNTIAALASKNMSKEWYYDLLREYDVCVLQYVFVAAATADPDRLYLAHMHILDACMELIDGMPVCAVSMITGGFYSHGFGILALQHCLSRKDSARLFVLHDDRTDDERHVTIVANMVWGGPRHPFHALYVPYIDNIVVVNELCRLERLMVSAAKKGPSRQSDIKMALYAILRAMTMRQKEENRGLCERISSLLGAPAGEASPPLDESLEGVLQEQRKVFMQKIYREIAYNHVSVDIPAPLAKEWKRLEREADAYYRIGTVDLVGKQGLIAKGIENLRNRMFKKRWSEIQKSDVMRTGRL